MEIEPYVLLCDASAAMRRVLVTPLRNLKLGFKAFPGDSKVWSVENENGLYTGFCSADAREFKDASEIEADSFEEYVLKLEAMGFVYGN